MYGAHEFRKFHANNVMNSIYKVPTAYTSCQIFEASNGKGIHLICVFVVFHPKYQIFALNGLKVGHMTAGTRGIEKVCALHGSYDFYCP